MAKIEDLIAHIADERLQKAIALEVKALKRTKKFGLVFEEHLPETVRLPRLPIREGDLVALKRETGNQLWRVRYIHNDMASCDQAAESHPQPKETGKEFPVAELVVVRSFGDPIYPALVPMDRMARGGPDKPWHILINADNFHALQLLLYCYEGKVDVIYIDPPYNTGARDWKYNNDYVDKADSFRHSKWLAMMRRRLRLAILPLPFPPPPFISNNSLSGDIAVDTFVHSSFGTVVMTLFQGRFSTPSWHTFTYLACGWAFASDRHTITTYMWLTGATAVKHFHASMSSSGARSTTNAGTSGGRSSAWQPSWSQRARSSGQRRRYHQEKSRAPYRRARPLP